MFKDVTHSDYFKGLKDPAEINHITYFTHCDASYAQKHYNHEL